MSKGEVSTVLVLIATLLSLSLSGCILSKKQRYTEKVDSWTGKHIDQLIRSMGYPDETTTSPMGNKLLVYRESKTVVKEHIQYDKSRPKNMKFYGVPYTTTENRTTFYEINNQGVIINSSWR